jgi:hypothetical protein
VIEGSVDGAELAAVIERSRADLACCDRALGVGSRLNELQQLFEAAEREKEALEWMQAQEREQNALAEKRRVEEAAKEEDREARKAERKAKKEVPDDCDRTSPSLDSLTVFTRLPGEHGLSPS